MIKIRQSWDRLIFIMGIPILVMWHRYNDVIMAAMASQITSLTSVYSSVYSGTNQRKKIKSPRHWPLWGEFTGDRWIPRTKGQLRGKYFHLMTSSCFCIETAPSVLAMSCMADSEFADIDIYGPWMKNQAPSVLNDDEGDLFMRLAMQMRLEDTQIARFMRGLHGAHLGPTWSRWAPCWPREPCYQGIDCSYVLNTFLYALLLNNDRKSGFPWRQSYL